MLKPNRRNDKGFKVNDKFAHFRFIGYTIGY